VKVRTIREGVRRQWTFYLKHGAYRNIRLKRTIYALLQNKTSTFCLLANNRRLPALIGNHNRWSMKHEYFSNMFTPFSVTVTLDFLKSRITYNVHPPTVTAKQRTFALEIQPAPKWQEKWSIHMRSYKECKYNSELPSLELGITSANKQTLICEKFQ
jgi:hypothetical protein